MADGAKPHSHSCVLGLGIPRSRLVSCGGTMMSHGGTPEWVPSVERRPPNSKGAQACFSLVGGTGNPKWGLPALIYIRFTSSRCATAFASQRAVSAAASARLLFAACYCLVQARPPTGTCLCLHIDCVCAIAPRCNKSARLWIRPRLSSEKARAAS